MKKLLCLLLAATLLFGAAACGKPQNTAPVNSPVSTPGMESSTDTAGRVLVLYFSATGSTKAVAEYIAAAAGGTLFAITPAEPYTQADLNWSDPDSRVCREHDAPESRRIALEQTAVPDWQSYDTVYIGYPIWWGIAAWPVSSFAAANDFTGKTVIPFCTSASSGLGSSGTLLAEAAGTGRWLEGIRFASGTDEATVAAWVQTVQAAQ